VSGAPKIKAIQLVSGLEKERRGVYAGAVGRFDFDRNELDTCIAIRTMTYKDGVVYLQAGELDEQRLGVELTGRRRHCLRQCRGGRVH